MKKHVLSTAWPLFLCLTIAYGLLTNYSLAQDFEIAINIEKRVFLYGEDVRVEYEIRNLSGKVMRIGSPHPITGCIRFEVRNSRGSILPHLGPSGGKRKRTIEVGEAIYRAYSLRDFYGRFDQSSFSPNLPIGSYTVKALLHCDGTRSNWLASNTITFEVEEPRGSERDAWRLMSEAKRLDTRRTRLLCVERFVDLINRHPGSVYIPEAFFKLANSYFDLGQKSRSRELLDSIIVRFPNSMYARNSANKISRDFLSESERESFFHEIARTYSNHKLGKMAIESLKGLKSK